MSPETHVVTRVRPSVSRGGGRASSIEDVRTSSAQDAPGRPLNARRKSAENMMAYLATQDEPVYMAGAVITKKTAKQGVLVVRGPDWSWGNEDGGAGQIGHIVDVDKKEGTATVHWKASETMRAHYRLGNSSKSRDLCVAVAAGEPAPATRRSGLMAGLRSMAPTVRGRRNSQAGFSGKDQTIIIFDWDDTLFPSTYIREDLRFALRVPLAKQRVTEAQMAEVKVELGKCAAQVVRLLRLADTLGKVVLLTLARSPWVTDSCANFYPGIGELIKELGLKIVYAQQGVQVEYDKVNMMADDEVEKFWSRMKGKAIAKELQSFYSQYDGQTWKNVISIGDSDFERLGTKGAIKKYMFDSGVTTSPAPEDGAQLPAIKSNALDPSTAKLASSNSTLKPDSPSPRSSSKASDSGVVSWNSADFAKINSAVSRCGVGEAEVDGHFYRVRRKTFKMLDEPTVGELTSQLNMLRNWLPAMVALDGGFDVNLSSLDNNDEIQAINDTLRGKDRSMAA